MEIKHINGFDEFQKLAEKNKKVWLVFYKPGHPASECALNNLRNADAGIPVMAVDVTRVRDIHGKMGVSSVPVLVLWQDGQVKNLIKGCQAPGFYKQLLSGEGIKPKPANGKSAPRVTVYTTPSCPYCNKLKQYLNKYGIRYTDINVAANQQAAQEMVRKSGQRGVPQTDINGKIIIGFDVPKLSKLLNIPTE